jgi:hypothetical protein
MSNPMADWSSNTAEIPEISTPARAFELRGSQYDWGYKVNRTEITVLWAMG